MWVLSDASMLKRSDEVNSRNIAAEGIKILKKILASETVNSLFKGQAPRRSKAYPEAWPKGPPNSETNGLVT